MENKNKNTFGDIMDFLDNINLKKYTLCFLGLFLLSFGLFTYNILSDSSSSSGVLMTLFSVLFQVLFVGKTVKRDKIYIWWLIVAGQILGIIYNFMLQSEINKYTVWLGNGLLENVEFISHISEQFEWISLPSSVLCVGGYCMLAFNCKPNYKVPVLLLTIANCARFLIELVDDENLLAISYVVSLISAAVGIISIFFTSDDKKEMHAGVSSSGTEHSDTKNTDEQKSRLDRLYDLKSLLDSGILTQEEFETEKNNILNE